MRVSFTKAGAIAAITLLVVCNSLLATGKPTAADKNWAKLLEYRVATLWYASLQAHINQLSLGTVRLHVTFSGDGKILHLRVLSNTSNELAATLAFSAIKDAKIPPIPADVLMRDRFDFEPAFTVYPTDRHK